MRTRDKNKFYRTELTMSVPVQGAAGIQTAFSSILDLMQYLPRDFLLYPTELNVLHFSLNKN